MAGGATSYSMNRRLAAAKQHEYSIVSNFTHGYRNREDITVLPPGVLIEGSQNVLTNTSERVGIRKGYVLDGAANTDQAPIGGDGTAMGTFDWVTSAGVERNMRAGFLTGAGNDGKLQFRHVNSVTGAVQWLDLLTSLTSVNFNFITFFDPTHLQTVMLAVDGTSNIYVWSGGTIEIASAANPTGIVASVADSEPSALVSFGKDYTVGDVLTLVGGNNDAKITVTSVLGTGSPDKTVATAGVTAGGSNYAIGDKFTVDPGAGGGVEVLCQVATLSGNAVASFTILNPGQGDYAVSGGNVTTTTTGVGTGCTVNILSLTGGSIADWKFASDDDHGTGYTVNTTYQLSGGAGTLAYFYPNYVVTGSITKSGTQTWAQAGFSFQTTALTSDILINGTTYSYESLDFLGNSTTLYGVTPDPSALSAGDLVIQGVTTVPNAGGISGLPTTFANQFISTVYGRIFIGSSSDSYIYVSNATTPTTQAWTHWTPATQFLSVNNPPASFIIQDDQLYISVGTSQWFVVKATTAADLTGTLLSVNPINTAALQGSQSQAMTTTISNSIGYVSFEPAVQSFGPVANILLSPQMVDLSFSIVNLMNDYDFTGGAIKYFRKFLYIAVPRESTVLIYNMTNPKNPYWEAPQRLPISRFSIINGELYGHSSQVSETYKLFTGYADRVTPTSLGVPISASWVFAYENYGSRFSLKRASKMYVEGYVSPNATLTSNIVYELDGCKTVKTFMLEGDDSQFVCVMSAEGSLGKESLGKVKLGGDQIISANNLPPKFRWFPTFSSTDFFECSVAFSVLGIDSQTEIVAFGLATGGSSEIPVKNMD